MSPEERARWIWESLEDGKGTCDEAGDIAKIAAALAAQVAQTRALLQSIEWQGHDSEGEPRCPECRAFRDEGHDADCALRAALTGAPREEPA